MTRILAAFMLLGVASPVQAQQQVQACTPEVSADTVRLLGDGRIEAVGNVELRLCDMVGQTDRAEIRQRPGAVAPTTDELQATSNRIQRLDERVFRLSGDVVLVTDRFEQSRLRFQGRFAPRCGGGPNTY
jgi:hypothetical protein